MLQLNISKSSTMLVALFFIFGCQNSSDVTNTDAYSEPEVQNFISLFETVYHNIGYHEGLPGPKIWMSKAVISDSYVASISFEVDSGKKNGPAVYRIYDYTKCSKTAQGFQVSRNLVGKYDAAEWKDLVRSGKIFNDIILAGDDDKLPLLNNYIENYW